MKSESLNPNDVIFLYHNDGDGLGPYVTCNLLANNHKFYLKNSNNEDMQEYFGKLHLKNERAEIQAKYWKHIKNVEKKDIEIYLKWKKSIKKKTLWQKVKIWWKNLFREDKKYYL